MQRLKRIISQVLGVSVDQINDQTSPENVDNWDSFNGLILVSELEREFQVKFTMQEMASVKCVQDIRTSLERQGIQFEDKA